MRATVLGSAMVVAAVVAAASGSTGWARDAYARQFYPALQAVLTPVSNQAPVPLFDLVLVSVVLVGLAGAVVGWRRASRTRSPRPLLRLAAAAMVGASIGYLWFLAAWGYNYRLAGVEAALPRYEPGRATPATVRRLAELAVVRVNERHAEAHARGFPRLDEIPLPLLSSLHVVERQLGRPRPTVASRPKRPWTAPYMRAVGVSGMLAPLFLETYLNPDLTGPERPYVLAHEWAHLAGYAREEDASFVGLLASIRADVPAQYSAWLFLMAEAVSQLHPVTRGLVLEALGPGPRADLAAIAERQRARVPWLDRASWMAYDQAIKSQGADAGVAGYGKVIALVLGSDALAEEGVTP